jgi:hypothetical protein
MGTAFAEFVTNRRLLLLLFSEAADSAVLTSRQSWSATADMAAEQPPLAAERSPVHSKSSWADEGRQRHK